MGTKKLEIGSCQWLMENKDDPGVRRVWEKQIAECEARQREREAKRMKERLNKVLGAGTAPDRTMPRM